MKLSLIILFLSCLTNILAQSNTDIDNRVNTIDSLFNKNALTSKEYPGKTLVGSLKAYYYHGKLVLIKTLTDAEYGGTETIYYADDSNLLKTYKMRVSFKDPNEWKSYFNSHGQNKNCFKCHSKNNCQKTVITFNNNQLEYYIDDKRSKTTHFDKDLEIKNTQKTFNSLLPLLKSF